MSINSTSNIEALLREGLAGFTGEYNSRPLNVRKIFKTLKSHRYQELMPEMQYTPQAVFKAQGANANYFEIKQLFLTQAINQTYQMGVSLTREMIDDNLYEYYFPQIKKSFTVSNWAIEEVVGTNVFNNGFTNNALTNLADGQPFFSTSHPIENGTISNTFASLTPLSFSSLLTALSNIKFTFKDAAGLFIGGEAKYLMVSSDLWPTAKALLGSKYDPSSPNNSINPIFGEIKDVIVNPYLNSGYWFVITNFDGLYHFNRQPVEISIFNDTSNFSVRVQSYMRFCMVCANFRAAFGARAA